MSEQLEAGPEMDAAVAAAFGWTREGRLWRTDRTGDHETFLCGDFSPSTDIADAFRVVDEMERRGWFTAMIGPIVSPEERYRFEFMREWNSCEARAQTRQLAICRSALAAVKAGVLACW